MIVPAHELLQVECYGGPQDGAVVFMPAGSSVVVFPRILFPTGMVERDIYALEATVQGRFQLKHIGTQDER
jgi:hypothetical protein